jgi:hypothetical protein
MALSLDTLSAITDAKERADAWGKIFAVAPVAATAHA